MGILKRYKYHILALLILFVMLVVSAKTKMARVTESADELPKVGETFQVEHALELFAANKASLAVAVANTVDRRQFILEVVRNSLSDGQKDKAFEIAHAVISEADHHKMDPLFLLAVISTESQFNITAHGSHGEIGLMQVLPKTAAWLAPQAGLPEDYDLSNPSVNIRIGATYLAHLRHSFARRSKRYLAAYNMGSTNVRRLLAAHTEPNIYPARVLNNYEQLYLALAENVGPVGVTREVASSR